MTVAYAPAYFVIDRIDPFRWNVAFGGTDCKTLFFESEEEATKWARENLQFWSVYPMESSIKESTL